LKTWGAFSVVHSQPKKAGWLAAAIISTDSSGTPRGQARRQAPREAPRVKRGGGVRECLDDTPLPAQHRERLAIPTGIAVHEVGQRILHALGAETLRPPPPPIR
jgi:hypothetical protein